MRPQSNLHLLNDFDIPNKEKNTGFIAAFRGKLGVQVNDFFHKLVIGSVLPSHVGIKVPAAVTRNFANRHVQDNDRKRTIKSILKTEKDYLIYSSPMASINHLNGNFSVGILDIEGYLAKEKSIDSEGKVEDTIFKAYNSPIPFSSIPGFDTLTRIKLKESLLSVELRHDTASDKDVFWLTWKISKAESEYLNSVSFAEINLGNFYSILVEWSASVMGRQGSLPERISPVSKVVSGVLSTIKGSNIKPRTGISGLCIDINRHILAFPEVNNAALYEQNLLEFGMQEPGVYSWSGLQEGVAGEEVKVGDLPPRKRLPINLPIYSDWLNDKFIYSNTKGNIGVYNLAGCVPLSNFHVKSFLDSGLVEDLKGSSPVSSELFNAIQISSSINKSIMSNAPVLSDFDNYPEDQRVIARQQLEAGIPKFTSAAMMLSYAFALQKTLNSESFFHNGDNVVVKVYQLDSLKGLGAFKFIGRAIQQAHDTIEDNIDNYYKSMGVLSVLGFKALLRLFVDTAGDYTNIVSDDLKDRDVYISQGVDPEHVVEPVPLIKKGLSYLPHQAKTENVTRKGPKFVIYPIDAGGGKTIVILTNILKELKAGRCTKTVILCPSHLVAQYIEEVIYVTEGRLNVIPVTNSSFKAHGEEKMYNFISKAPKNSVVVTDMHFLSSRDERVAYGNKTIQIFRNVEFLRQFEFDLVAVDEVHYLKNVRSGRRAAAARFIQDIPMKRLASGTFISDTMVDLVSQVALLDPSLFGSEEQFKRDYALEMSGDKVLQWKKGAEADVRKLLQEHAVVAGAKRKEWAALLPPSEEVFLAVELSDTQRLMYESILQETVDLINEAVAKNPELKDLLANNDEDGSLEDMLRPYLARLEKFLSAPAEDQASEIFLKDEDDKLSPKLAKAYERCYKHIAEKLPGKILIFTQYTSTAESFFLYAPADLKSKIVHYTAANKLECKVEFENDPNKIIMIGVSSSMDTGLNLQHVSRLIRLESVWTPGVLEQGNSRLNRPQLKKAEDRNVIFFDTILVNRTVDVTKIARLISKIVSKSKFDEFDNEAYQEIEDLPKVKLTLESIASNNDFAEGLLPYLEVYQEYKKVQKEDYENYKKENGNKLVPVPVPQGGMLPDSKLMSRIPYIPGMQVYGTAQLGLVRYDEFLRTDIDSVDDSDVREDSDSEDDTEIDSNDPRAVLKRQLQEKRQKERILLKDKAVHTDFGDGVVTGLGNKFVRVRLSDGTRVRLLKMQVFVITRTSTNNIDLRNELLKQVGDLPLDTPINVPVESVNKKKGKPLVEEDESLEFNFTVINDFLGIMVANEEISAKQTRVLQNLGFKTTVDYAFTRVSNAKILIGLFKAWKAKQFTITKAQSTLFKDIFDTIKGGNRAALNKFGLATQLEFTNFYREQIKPSSDNKAIKVYPLIQDGILYLMLPTKGQMGNVRAMKVMSPGIRWSHGGGDNEMLALCKTKGEAKELVKKIINSGLPVSNLKELGIQFKAIKLS